MKQPRGAPALLLALSTTECTPSARLENVVLSWPPSVRPSFPSATTENGPVATESAMAVWTVMAPLARTHAIESRRVSTSWLPGTLTLAGSGAATVQFGRDVGEVEAVGAGRPGE